MTKPVKERDCERSRKKQEKKKKEFGGKELQDMDPGEIQELIDTTLQELTEENLMKMRPSEPVPENGEEDIETVPAYYPKPSIHLM